MLEQALRITVWVLISAVVVLRAPGAIRIPCQRPVWFAALALLGTATLDLARIEGAIGSMIPVAHLAEHLKHLCALGCAAALLAFITRLIDTTHSRRGRRIHSLGALAATAALVSIFVLAHDQSTRDRFLGPPATVNLLIVYWLVYCSYMGTVGIWSALLFWRHLPRSPRGVLRATVLILATGATTGVVYVAFRGMMVLSASREIVTAMSVTSSLALLLMSVGLCLAALCPIQRAIIDWRHRHQLYPLWRDLIGAVPNVALELPRIRLLDLLALQATRLRLYRRVIEIRDAMLILRDYASTEIISQARDHVANRSIRPSDVESAATACWLELARNAQRSDRVPQPCVAPAAMVGGADLDTEVDFLIKVAHSRCLPVVRAFINRQAA